MLRKFEHRINKAAVSSSSQCNGKYRHMHSTKKKITFWKANGDHPAEKKQRLFI